ncbi:MAG: 1-phosphofructokinase family hexose kinase [Chitinophagaceae bacterium]
MAKIITVTINPVIDKSTSVAGIVPEKKLRCEAPKFEPGGGGINVARAIKKLGGEALAIYPAGGYTGRFLNDLLRDEGIKTKVVDIKKPTRENLIVVDSINNQQFRFGMPGPELLEQEWKACLQSIEEENDIEYIVASGSLSPGVPVDIYAQIAGIAKAKGARLIVDTSGEALQAAADEGIFLLKPNLAELSSLAGREEINAELVDDVAREVIAKGKCEVVVVSLGAAGAMLVTASDIVQATPPAVKKRSTVGAGDSMVAGIVWSLSKGCELKDALRYGVASGTAATMNSGTELCKLKDVECLYPLIRVVQLQS